jgi:hypothetical protein
LRLGRVARSNGAPRQHWLGTIRNFDTSKLTPIDIDVLPIRRALGWPGGRNGGSPPFAMFCRQFEQCLLRAMKPIRRSQWNDGFSADSGPSRGDSRRRYPPF